MLLRKRLKESRRNSADDLIYDKVTIDFKIFGIRVYHGTDEYKSEEKVNNIGFKT